MRRDFGYYPLIAAFALGLLIGGAAGIRYEKKVLHGFWKRGPDTNRIFADLTHRLNLDAGQQKKLQAILDANQGQMMDLHRQVASQMEGLRASFRQNLGGILTSEQQKKFAAMTAQWDARRMPMTVEAGAQVSALQSSSPDQ